MLPGVRNVSVVKEKNRTQAAKNTAMESTWALSARKSAAREPCGREV